MDPHTPLGNVSPDVVSISVPSKSVINNLHFFMIQNLNDM